MRVDRRWSFQDVFASDVGRSAGAISWRRAVGCADRVEGTRGGKIVVVARARGFSGPAGQNAVVPRSREVVAQPVGRAVSGARGMAALFTLRVNLPEGLDPAGDEASARREGRPRDDGEVDAEDDATGPWQTLEFSAGNPRAEIISGRLRLFRDSTTSASSSGALPEGRAPVVCVLAVPSSLSVTDFCEFAAALIPKVVEMRMVKASPTPSPANAARRTPHRRRRR